MTKAQEMELLPCPFCGGTNIKALAHLDWVACDDCGASLEDVEPSARELWNTRLAAQSADAKPKGEDDAMTKATEEMLALADKIEYSIKTEGEITLFETNGTRVVYVLRSLAAQSAGEPPAAREPVAWRAENDFGYWYVTQDPALADTWREIEQFDVQPLYAALSVPPGDQAREITDEMLNSHLLATGEWVDPYEAECESGVPIECDISQEDADDINAGSREQLRKGYIAALSVPPGDQAREAVISECLEAAYKGFDAAMDQYVLIGPSGMARMMFSAIRSLSSEVKKP